MVISALASTVRWLAEQRQNRVPVSGSNPFLEGPYAPVSVESSCDELRVEGEIPRELNGLLARIGPNPLTPPNPATYHWFVGDGMVHGLRLRVIARRRHGRAARLAPPRRRDAPRCAARGQVAAHLAVAARHRRL